MLFHQCHVEVFADIRRFKDCLRREVSTQKNGSVSIFNAKLGLTRIPSRELTYPPQKWHFEDDFPFPKVGYVNSLEGK